MRYAVLGTGRQGLAVAYDLARFGEAEVVTLVDRDADAVRRAAARLRRLVPRTRFLPVVHTLHGPEAAPLLRGQSVVVSALPFRFNPPLARAALEAGVSFCDLGGHTGLVREQLRLHREARRAGVTIVPDCGLAPGLANMLAAAGVRDVPGARSVRIHCGGLPRVPTGPLGYVLLFSLEGLLNEYLGEAVLLRRGRIVRRPALGELAPFRWSRALPPLEGFLTAGGTSTGPWTYRGLLESYEYKTLRYPGHCEKIRALRDLGLLDAEPVAAGGCRIAPRTLFEAVAGPRLRPRGVPRDLVLLQVDVRDGRGRGVRYRLLDRYDRRTGLSAMERTTGFPTAALAHAIARGRLPPGAFAAEAAPVPGSFLTELRRRGLAIRRTRLKG